MCDSGCGLGCDLETKATNSSRFVEMDLGVTSEALNGSGTMMTKERKKKVLPEADRRSEVLTIRLTRGEVNVVKAMCEVYGCSQSMLVRMLYTYTLPPVVPEMNVAAFGVLDKIAFDISELALRHAFEDLNLAQGIAGIEQAIDRLRSSLLTPVEPP